MKLVGVLVSLALCLGNALGQGRFYNGLGGPIIGGHPGFMGPHIGNGFHHDPPHIRRILGSTDAGRELRMGERGLPRHGGAGIGEQYADGLNNGWDGNPQTLTNQFEHSWSDPFQGRAIPQVPLGFNGDFASLGGIFSSMPAFGGHIW